MRRPASARVSPRRRRSIVAELAAAEHEIARLQRRRVRSARAADRASDASSAELPPVSLSSPRCRAVSSQPVAVRVDRHIIACRYRCRAARRAGPRDCAARRRVCQRGQLRAAAERRLLDPLAASARTSAWSALALMCDARHGPWPLSFAVERAAPDRRRVPVSAKTSATTVSPGTSLRAQRPVVCRRGVEREGAAQRQRALPRSAVMPGVTQRRAVERRTSRPACRCATPSRIRSRPLSWPSRRGSAMVPRDLRRRGERAAQVRQALDRQKGAERGRIAPRRLECSVSAPRVDDVDRRAQRVRARLRRPRRCPSPVPLR